MISPVNRLEPSATAKRKLRVAVLNYTGDRKNWGCQATSRYLLRWIEGAFEAFAEIEWLKVPMLSRTPSYYEVEKEAFDRIRKTLRKKWIFEDDTLFLRQELEKLYGSDLVESFAGCDLAVFQAEGTMAGTDLLKADGLLLAPFWFQAVLGVPVLSLNQTLFSVSGDFERTLFNVLDRFPLVAVRERASYDYARWNKLGRTLLIPDTAFLTERVWEPHCIEPVKSGDTVAREGYYCVSGSAVIEFVDRNMLLEGIADLDKRLGLKPVLLVSSKQDDVLLEEIVERLGDGVGRVRRDASPEAVVGVLKKAAFLVGGRYHMSILSAVAHTPFLSFESNTFKNEGLLKLLDLDGSVTNVGMLKEFSKRVEAILADRDRYRKHLKRQMRAIHEHLEVGSELMRSFAETFVMTGKPVPFHRLAKGRKTFEVLSPAPVGLPGTTTERLRQYRSAQVDNDVSRGFINRDDFAKWVS